MAKKSIAKKQPGLVFYRPAVDDILKRGDIAEMKALIRGAKSIQTRFGDIDGLVAKLQATVKKVQGQR